VQRWDPLAVVDLHVTDGAQFEHDIAVMVEPVQSGDLALRQIGRAWRDGVVADLKAQGSLPLPFYPSFEVEDDPSSGFRDGVSPPRFSTGYFPLRNRLAMLVETHSWKPYAERVQATRHAVLSVLQRTAVDGRSWQREAQAADQRARALAGQTLVLDWASGDRSHEIEFRGYAYQRELSDVSGASMTRYDETRPALLKLPLHDQAVPRLQVQAPRAGYLVPPAQAAQVARWLVRHGLQFSRLARDVPAMPVQRFRADSWRFGTGSVEGHQMLGQLVGAWQDESLAPAAGALFVPIAQPGARLVVALLEPQAPDSMLAWGEFNNFFEKKEYMEAYVAEAVAREQLAADPALAAVFQQRLSQDPAFAASPQDRLEFFHRRHASWDGQYGLYPIWRLEQPPAP
jgi:hypothetical protein